MTSGSITVLGGGALALAAAIALKRAVPGWRIVAIPGDGAADRQPGAADTTITAFHEQVGLPHMMVQRVARAVPVTATVLSGWGARDFTVPQNARERFADGVSVHQLWFRREGAAVPSLDRLLDDPAAPPGWRFDRGSYADLLRRMAQQIGVEEAGAVGGDLVVDCGPGEQGDGDWEDWSARIPTLTAEPVGAGAAMAGATERLVRRGDTIEWVSANATARLSPSVGKTGRRRSPWRGTAIAIGPAAIALPPLFGLPLSTALGDVLRLVRLLPQAGDAASLAAEYNRQTAIVHQALLDYASVPLAWGPDRLDDPSPGVTAVLAQFRRRGRIPLREGDPIGRGRWIALLAGLGVRPDRIDPVARIPDDNMADRILSTISAPRF